MKQLKYAHRTIIPAVIALVCELSITSLVRLSLSLRRHTFSLFFWAVSNGKLTGGPKLETTVRLTTTVNHSWANLHDSWPR